MEVCYLLNMLSDFISKKLHSAKYQLLKDGSFYAEIPDVKGVWAHAKTLDQCRTKLREILEEWIVLKLRSGDKIAGLALPSRTRPTGGHPAHYA